jgi:hypothetical protein
LQTCGISDFYNYGWKLEKTLLIKRIYPLVESYGNKLYIVGGINKTYVTSFDTMEIYDTVTKTIDYGTPMPIPVTYAGVCRTGQKIYYFGGLGKDNSISNPSNITQIYDIINDTWSYGSDMPTKKFSAEAVCKDDEIFVISGYDGIDDSITIDIYNTIHNNWTEGGNISIGRSKFAAVLMNGGEDIYVLGGGPLTDSIEIYNIANKSSRVDSTTLLTSRFNIGAENIGNTIYLASGFFLPYIKSTEIYKDGTIRYGPDLNIGSVGLTSAIINDTTMVVIHGNDEFGEFTSDIEYFTPINTFCFGIACLSDSVCSSNGVCYDTDKCKCIQGYTGLNCSSDYIAPSGRLLWLEGFGIFGIVILSIIIVLCCSIGIALLIYLALYTFSELNKDSDMSPTKPLTMFFGELSSGRLPSIQINFTRLINDDEY